MAPSRPNPRALGVVSERSGANDPRSWLLADVRRDAIIVSDARTQNRLRADHVRERLIAVFVLIDRPCRLNIPHLAMNLARSKENSIQQLAIDMLPQLVGRKCALWVAQHCAKTTKLLRSRNYVPPKTAFYCDWLKFLDEAAARQFVQTWPRYDLQLQLRKVRAEHRERALKLERDLSVGRYDLARLPANKRWSAASRYITAHETLRKLAWDGKNLELAAELSSIWSRHT